MKNLSLLCLIMVLTGTVFAAGQIDIFYAPYTISTPGSYIVVNDLSVDSNTNCITVNADNVTIDLNGHTLTGAGAAVGSSGSGIYSIYNYTAVYNGTVCSFQSHGIYLSGLNCRVNQTSTHENGGYGINLGYNGLVYDNMLYANSGGGIWTGNAAVVRNNSVRYNGGIGINVTIGVTVISNSVYGNSTGIDASGAGIIKDNTVASNNADGILVNADCQVVGNTCYDNAGAGIHAISSDNFFGQNLCTVNITGLLCNGGGNYVEQNKLRGNTTAETLNGSAEGAGALANVNF